MAGEEGGSASSSPAAEPSADTGAGAAGREGGGGYESKCIFCRITGAGHGAAALPFTPTQRAWRALELWGGIPAIAMAFFCAGLPEVALKGELGATAAGRTRIWGFSPETAADRPFNRETEQNLTPVVSLKEGGSGYESKYIFCRITHGEEPGTELLICKNQSPVLWPSEQPVWGGPIHHF